MPILARDKNGNLYVTGRDRSDGLGFSSYAIPVGQSSNTLGNGEANRQRDLQAEIMNNRQYQAEIDRQERINAQRYKEQQAYNQRRRNAIQAMVEDPAYHASAMRRAAMNGCDCQTVNSGKMSGNGQKGWAGLSRDQQAIHNHFAGIGHDVSGKMGIVERNQRLTRGAVEKGLSQQTENRQRNERVIARDGFRSPGRIRR